MRILHEICPLPPGVAVSVRRTKSGDISALMSEAFAKHSAATNPGQALALLIDTVNRVLGSPDTGPVTVREPLRLVS